MHSNVSNYRKVSISTDLKINQAIGIIVTVLMSLRIKRMQRVARSSRDRNGGTVETKVVGKDESTRPA